MKEPKRNITSTTPGRWLLAIVAIVFVLGVEVVPGVTRYVVKNNPGASYPYTNWATAAASIQQAVDACVDGDEVIVTNGVYDNGFGLTPEGPFYFDGTWRHQTNRVVILRNITVRSMHGPGVTEIVGVRGGPTGYVDSIRAVFMTNGVLAGFTIRNGHVWYGWIWQTVDRRSQLTECGSGVNILGAGVVSNCVIRDNGMAHVGGGVYGSGEVVITHCEIRNNWARFGGGAGFNRTHKKARVENTLLLGNVAYYAGGGIFFLAQANHCTIVSNAAENAVMTNNPALHGGGGVLGVEFVNSIVMSNQATGLGIEQQNYSPLWTNEYAIQYSCTVPQALGVGNVGADPRFVNFAGGNYRLQNTSPCIGRASEAYLTSDRDLDFNPRNVCGPDMGCYENQSVGVYVTNTPIIRVAWSGPWSMSVGGTNTMQIVGGMWASNVTAGTRVNFAAPGAPYYWTTPAIGLVWGKNEIVVYGTNAYGGMAYSKVTVWKYNIDGSGQQSGSVYGKRVAGWLKAWGNNSYGQCNVPGGNNYVAVAAGDRHSVALRNDGSLVAWGDNTYGQCNVPGGSNYMAVAAGWFHTVALRSDGSIVAWGQNGSGQTNCPPGNNYVAVAAGGYHSAALRSDGRVVCWGEGLYGQTNSPAGYDFVAIAAGYRHTAGLRSDGTVMAWGRNQFGQCNVPLVSNFVAISAGGDHTVGVRSDGSLVAWGRNDAGQANVPLGNDYLAASGGGLHNIAMRSSGSLVGWGSNGKGQTNAPPGVYELMASGGEHNIAIGGAGSYPYVDITNGEERVVFNQVTSIGVGGTNSVGVVGNKWWVNSLGGSGVIGPGLGWSFSVNLGVGTNVITVTGTNVYGVSVSDGVRVIRTGFDTPFVVVTTVAHSVSYETTSRSVAGTNGPHVVGMMWASNVTTGARVDFAAPAYPAGWTTPALGLNVGANVIRVYGTNALGTVAYGGEVTITRLAAGSGTPLVVLTTTAHTVSYETTSRSVAGTNNVHVVGGMWASNVTTGTRVDFAVPAYPAGWTTPALGLNVGANVIRVYGTNMYGTVAYGGEVTITRLPAGSGTPLVVVTTQPHMVSYVASSVSVAGTNNVHVVGGMWASNVTAGTRVNFAAPAYPPGWVTPAIGLVAGANVIRVYGTNLYGQVGWSEVVITRGLSNEVYLIAPPDGWKTNVASVALQVYYGPGITTPELSTNGGVSWFAYTSPVVFGADGKYRWTARGNGVYYAPQTNELWVITKPPVVKLVSPADGVVFTNVFAIDLVASYGLADVRQLSTNDGASWFEYDPMVPVQFSGTGEWRWTARGINIAGVGYADRTNVLRIVVTGTRPTIANVAPAHGAVLTNANVTFRRVKYSAGYTVYDGIMTNDQWHVTGSTELYPLTFGMGEGVHRWSAYGTYQEGMTWHWVYAPTTNRFEVIEPGTAAVRLLAPKDRAVFPVGYIHLDVLYSGVGARQISTNDGVTWMAYESPLWFGEGYYRWTARGTNAAGEWVYANTTNRLYVGNVNPGARPTITIEHPNVLTTAFTNVAYDGTYNLDGGLLQSIRAYRNGDVLTPVVYGGGGWQVDGGLTMTHGSVNNLLAVLTLQDGVAATATWTIVCDTNYVPDIAVPQITIEHPSQLTTAFTQVAFDGTYSANGGILAAINAYHNGNEVTPLSYSIGTWQAVNGLTLTHGSINHLTAVIRLANGNAATATWTIVCDTNYLPDIAVPSITIEHPNQLTTAFTQVAFDGTYSANGGVLEWIKLYNNGFEQTPVSYANGTYVLVGGLAMTHGSVNNLMAIIRLSNGNMATATWTIVCDTNYLPDIAVPSITIQHPNQLTTAFLNVAFDGTYSANGGILEEIKAYNNGAAMEPLVYAGGTWQVVGGLTMTHGSENNLMAIIRLSNGNAATATWTIVCDTNYLPDIAVPSISILNPNVLTTAFLNVGFNGTYALNGGILQVIETYNNGQPVEPLSYANGLWQVLGGLTMEPQSVNNLMAIIKLSNGNAATATWTIVCDTNYLPDIAVPWITIDYPNMLTTALLNVVYEGRYGLNGGIFQSLRAYHNGLPAEPVVIGVSNWLVVGGLTMTHGSVNNLMAIIRLANGNAATATWTIVCDTNFTTNVYVEISDFRIALSNDNLRTILTWSNGVVVTLLAQTNQYYAKDGPWHVLAANVTSPWVHEDASNYWAVFYRAVSGNATSAYDVGLFAISINASNASPQRPVEAWVSTPLQFFDGKEWVTLNEVFGGVLTPGTLSSGDAVGQQLEYGGASYDSTYLASLGRFSGNDSRTNFYYRKGYVVKIKNAKNPLTIRFVGLVATNAYTVGPFPRQQGSEVWVGSYYPTWQPLNGSGLTNGVMQAGTLSTGDAVAQQLVYGGSSFDSVYLQSVGRFSGVDGRTNLWPGKRHVLKFRNAQGATNWTVRLPY